MTSGHNTLASAERFKALHTTSSLFVMPCAWDSMSAIMFERAGFPCIGTTSGGVNWVRGRKDYVYSTPREEMLAAYGEIATSTILPVSGDLENGYGESPEAVATTIALSIAEGMVGGSIEDQGIVPTDEAGANGTLIDFELSVERIRAARIAADNAKIPYTLTARCEVYYTNCKDPYAEAVKRLNAYREAGADCLFVPGLNKLQDLKRLVNDVDGPVSFGMGATPKPLTLRMLEDVGIRRVSTGGGLARATFGLLASSVQDLVENGTFDYLDGALSEADVNKMLDGEKIISPKMPLITSPRERT
ncbi:MAG: isocitrate lyase/phosphoenolpyruvate mutase family protein [Granulosicoccus sp.]|nr:isocitrate lyase/phosphoenolpyruvate mutase family protein [Granulosicoccus sp.]